MPGSAESRSGFFAGIGPTLIRYEADAGTATLNERQRVTTALDIQYAWPHPRLPLIYLATSNGGPGRRGDCHSIVTLRIEEATGDIIPFGSPCDVPWRPLHLSLDRENRHLLLAHNDPSGITVVSIDEYGHPGPVVRQNIEPDCGIFGHQILPTPSGAAVILPCRGHDADAATPEQPGGLRIFNFRDGQLAHRKTVAPGDGFGFGARHLDFHPSLPLLYLAVERQSELHVFTLDEGIPADQPIQKISAVDSSVQGNARQAVSAIHVHPDGQTLYISNRAYGSVDTASGPGFPYGDNSIGVFSIDAESGLVTPVQHVPTRGNLPRTFSIDPSGRMLVAANSEAGPQIDADGNTTDAPLSLMTWSIARDGTLTFVQRIEFAEREQLLFWAGFL